MKKKILLSNFYQHSCAKYCDHRPIRRSLVDGRGENHLNWIYLRNLQNWEEKKKVPNLFFFSLVSLSFFMLIFCFLFCTVTVICLRGEMNNTTNIYRKRYRIIKFISWLRFGKCAWFIFQEENGHSRFKTLLSLSFYCLFLQQSSLSCSLSLSLSYFLFLFFFYISYILCTSFGDSFPSVDTWSYPEMKLILDDNKEDK